MERAARFFMCKRSKIARIAPLLQKEQPMLDASLVILTITAFAVMIGYAHLCERL